MIVAVKLSKLPPCGGEIAKIAIVPRRKLNKSWLCRGKKKEIVEKLQPLSSEHRSAGELSTTIRQLSVSHQT